MRILTEDIPYDLQNMAKITGEDTFLEICKMYGGSFIYIPVYTKVIMGSRNREIAKDYNGKNVNDLRHKYNLSCQQIKNILRQENKM